MIARVALPIPHDELFDYLVPEGLDVGVGHRVQVPLGKRAAWGIVVELLPAPTREGLQLRPLLRSAGPALPPWGIDLVAAVARRAHVTLGLALAQTVPTPARLRAGTLGLALSPADVNKALEEMRRRAPRQAAVLALVAEGRSWEELRTVRGAPSALRALVRKGFLQPSFLPFAYREERPPPSLNHEQGQALEQVLGLVGEGKTCLLFGPPASGKTEVYLEAARAVAEERRSAVLLEPEVSLLPQLWARARGRLGFDPYAYHGGLAPGARWQAWEAALHGRLRCAVGTRSAVFLPARDLGLVVVDEESEPAYKQDERAPYYHAREVAQDRARIQGCAVLLGSAAPAVTTFHRAEIGEIGLLKLQERWGGAPPQVRAVPKSGKILGAELQEAIRRHLDHGGQVLLFLNRLGFFTGAICRGCHSLLRCPSCALGLVYHRNRGFICHACGYSVAHPRCPTCGGDRFRLFGLGTERVEHEVKRCFPGTPVARLDSSTSRDAGGILAAVARGEVRILVGTQMIGKGLDFPGITLVGIIDADLLLGRPDYRGAERTYQVIVAAAGRAGRGTARGEVLVQTDQPDYYPIRHALTGNYGAFYQEELNYRRTLRYPPFAQLVRLVAEGPQGPQRLEKVGRAVARPGVEVLGPSPLLPRRGIPRAQLLLRGDKDLPRLLHELLPLAPTWLRVDPDPLTFW